MSLQIDFARTKGIFRPLHGVNKGPLAAGGLLDVTNEQRALGIPFTRLHDCHWPNPDVVDMHVVFPNMGADPEQASSYDFALTDEYIAATRATGAQIIYRLGESIEHTTVKRYVHPPQDNAKWTAAALGIIRHYNEGWANGFRYNIRYWEIWNEPENRPAMWSGTDADYFKLYQTTAHAIKARYPDLKVGGPAVGNSGQFVNGQFQPSAFVSAFLDFCRREKVPLDFFSWHCYTADPADLTERAKAIRHLLDAYGFTKTESHLNEWNYLPGNTWEPVGRTATAPARQQYYAQMSGAPGAAFIAAALLKLQDAPVDVCNLFHGEVGGFGLFNEYGVPQKNYYAVLAFQELMETPQRVKVQRVVENNVASNQLLDSQLTAEAGVSVYKRRAIILISNIAPQHSTVRLKLKDLPWQETTTYDLRLVDDTHDLKSIQHNVKLGTSASIDLELKSPCVALLTLRPAEATPLPNF